MSQKIKTSVEIDGSLTASQIANATTDTDKFLVSDGGTVKYRTGAELASDLGIASGSTSKVQHQVKAGVAINKGQAVYVTSADGTNMIVGLASNASESTSSKTMGLLNATVVANGFADVITEGLLDGLNTSTATVGDPIWLGTGGNLIYGLANKPYAPNHLVFIGIVTRVNANNGEIFVKVQNGFELDEIHDVDLKTTTKVNGHLLGYNGSLWVNKTIAEWLGYTPYNASNPAGYISSYTETDTLASVTSRGAVTTSDIFTPNNGGIFFNGNSAYGSGIFGRNFGQDLAFNSGGVERIRLNSLGNFGLGTASPISGGGSAKWITIDGTASYGGGVVSSVNGSAKAYYYFDGTNAVIQGASGVGISFQPNNSSQATLNTSGDFTVNSSLRAPIFYDSNDTSYYTNPASTSVLSSVVLRGASAISFYGAGNGTYNIGSIYSSTSINSWEAPLETDSYTAARVPFILTWRGGYSAKGGLKLTGDASGELGGNVILHAGNYSSYAVPTSRTITINGTTQDLSANRSWTVTASETDTLATVVSRGNTANTSIAVRNSISINKSDGSSGGQLSYDSSINQLYLWNSLSSGYFSVYTNNAERLNISSGGAVTANVDMRSPIFYDSNNTGYYWNPATDASHRFQTPYGYIDIGPKNSSYCHIYTDRGSFYFNAEIDMLGNRVLHAGNYSNYAWPLQGSWKPASLASSTRLRGATSPDGGEFALAYSGGQIHPYADGFFYQNEGAYRVMDSNSIGDYTVGNYRTIADYSGDSTWYMRPNGRFVFANAHDWTQTFELLLPPGGSNNNTWAHFGQRQSNTTNGNFTGVSIRRYISGSSNLGDLQAGNMYGRIFYDDDNTAYYLDPASTSNLNGLTVANTITGSVSGSSGSVGGISASQIVYGSGSSKISSHANANEWRNSGFYENDGGGSNWPSGTWYNSINVRHSNQGNYHGFQVAMSYYDNNLWFRSYQGAGTFQGWQRAAVARGEGTNYIDYSRYVYNNGAYSGSGWVEPSDLGVRYANSAGSATNATNSDNAGHLRTAYAGGVQSNPQVYFNNTIGLKAAMTGHWSVWSDTLWINGYSGGDVPNMCALHFLRNGTPRMAISTQSFSSSSYGTIYEVLSNYGGTGTYSTTGDFRAPIFYDSNNTGRYVDPAGTSSVADISLNGAIYFPGSGTNVRIQESYGVLVNCISTPWNFQVINGSSLIGFGASGGNYGIGNGYFTGDVTAYYSDRRLKHNLTLIDNAVEKVKSLNGYTYQHNELGQELLNENAYKSHAGLIAQEVQAVLPEVVTIAPFDLDGYDEQGVGISKSGENYLTIKYERIVPLLIEAIKEQQTQIEELKELVNKLINKQ